MTQSQFSRLRATTVALLALFLFMFGRAAHSEEWKPSVPIHAWCSELETIDTVVQMDADGLGPEADIYVMRAIKSGECVSLPMPMASFRPAEIVKKYPAFDGEPATVIRGYLLSSEGEDVQEVFVIVPDKLLNEFHPGATPAGLKQEA